MSSVEEVLGPTELKSHFAEAGGTGGECRLGTKLISYFCKDFRKHLFAGLKECKDIF